MLVCELAVDSGEGISASLNIRLVLGVKVDLDNSLSINLHSGALSNNLSRVDDVFQDGVLDGSKCAGSWAWSICFLVTVERLAQDGTLSNNQNVTSRELLFQFTDKSLVDLVDGLQQFEWNVKNDSLLSVSTVNLLGSCDVDATKRSLQLCGGHLKVEKLVGNRLLEFIGFLITKSITVREGHNNVNYISSSMVAKIFIVVCQKSTSSNSLISNLHR